MAPARKFSFRAFISLLTLVVFLVMAVSGIILFACPARLFGDSFCFLTISFEQWTDLHVIFSFAFVILGVIHTILNLKPLVAYAKGKVSSTGKYRLELLIALAIAIIFFVATMANLEPFSTILSASEKSKAGISSHSTPKPTDEPSNLTPETPIPTPIPVVSVTPSPTPSPTPTAKPVNKLEEPVECEGNEGCGKGRSLGVLTLEQICESYDIDLDKALARLKKEGIDVTPDSKVRHIADELGLFPDNILKMLRRL